MHIYYLAPYLVSRGWDVHILSMEGNAPWKFGRIEKRDGYKIYRPSRLTCWGKLWSSSPFSLETLKYARRFGAIELAKYVKWIALKNDIKIISAYHIFNAGFASAIVSRELSIPLVTSVFGEIYSRQKMYQERISEVRYVIENSKKILSCSKHCARSFETIGLHTDVDTIYYGIDTKQFSDKPSPNIIRQRLGINRDVKIVLFVARMVVEMGLQVLLDAIPPVLEEEEKVVFMVVGRSGELLPSANKAALNYPGKVFVIADVPLEDLPLYYAASSFVVVPSINARACLGLAIAEAMASKKPVLVSDIGGGAEVVVNEETGYLFPPNDSKALCAQIINMLGTEERILLAMGEQGRKRALTLFDKDETNRKMEQVFLGVLQ